MKKYLIRKGFTLIEIMVVIVIGHAGNPCRAEYRPDHKLKIADANPIQNLETALKLYS
jgi:hypothetical protein